MTSSNSSSLTKREREDLRSPVFFCGDFRRVKVSRGRCLRRARRILVALRRPPQPVQREEQKRSKQRVHRRANRQLHVQPRLRLTSQQQPPDQREKRLLNDEESHDQRKPRRRMLRVEPGPNRRSQIPHHRFANPVKSQRHGRPTQRVLRKPDHRAQQQSGRRVAPAQPKINRHQQRQVQNLQSREIHRERSLQDQGRHGNHYNRAREKLVHLNVRPAGAQLVCVVHGFSAAAVFPDAGFCAAGADSGVPVCASASFLNSSGCCVSSTITSSSRSSFAAGRTRICLNGLPGFTSTTVPIGTSRGKILSIPLVTTCSPMATLSSAATYFITSVGSPVPPTGLWIRDCTNMAPAPPSLSVSTNTCAAS